MLIIEWYLSVVDTSVHVNCHIRNDNNEICLFLCFLKIWPLYTTDSEAFIQKNIHFFVFCVSWFGSVIRAGFKNTWDRPRNDRNVLLWESIFNSCKIRTISLNSIWSLKVTRNSPVISTSSPLKAWVGIKSWVRCGNFLLNWYWKIMHHVYQVQFF